METASKLDQGSIGKALYTKAKSSNFGPIAGDIPFDVRLSKLVEDNEAKENIPYFQKLNEDALTASEGEYKPWKGKVSKNNMADFNNNYLMTTVPKKDEQGREVYFLLGQDKNIVTTNDNIPQFVVKDNISTSKYYFYNNLTHKFNTEPGILPENSEIELVQIMAYRYFTPEKGEITRPITADYDELMSASRKVYPLHINTELQTTYTIESEVITIEMKSLLAQLEARIDKNEIITKNDISLIRSNIDEPNILPVLEYERKLKRHNRETANRQAMGQVNDWQRDVKTYLKEETEGATNHGPEVNNPFPEDITKDVTYVAFIPEGKGIELIHGEKELCQFINNWREQGFPLDINPKWGWEIDEQGKLYISTKETSWKNVLQEIYDLKQKVHNLEEELASKMRTLGLQPIDDNIEYLSLLKNLLTLDNDITKNNSHRMRNVFLNSLKLTIDKSAFIIPNEVEVDNLDNRQKTLIIMRKQYLSVIDLMNKLVEIKRLELEPDIVYSDFMNPKNETYTDIGIEELLITQSDIARSNQKDLRDRLSEYKENAELYNKVAKQVIRQKTYRDNIIPIIQSREKQERQEKVNKLNTELNNLLDNFSLEFEGETTEVGTLISALEKYKISINSALPLKQSSNDRTPFTENRYRNFPHSSNIATKEIEFTIQEKDNQKKLS
jgi:hypothetical protein